MDKVWLRLCITRADEFLHVISCTRKLNEYCSVQYRN